MLRAVGFTLEGAYKAYLELVNIATVFLSFYAFYKITRNDIAALAGSVLYAGCTQRVILMYSVVMGGVSGMTFYPLIVAGFYLLFTEDTQSDTYRKNWILLTTGFTGILMTHMISCLMVGLYSVLLCVIMWKKVMRKKTFVELVKAAGAAVLLNLWYLVPFVQYMLQEQLRINTKIAQSAKIEDYYAALADFTQEGKTLYQLFTDYNTLSFAMVLVLLLYIVTIPLQQKNRQTASGRVLALFTLLTVLVCTNLFPAVTLAKMSKIMTKFFQTIQYQYRLMSIAVVMVAALAAVFFTMEVFDRQKLYYIIGALCCIMLYQNFQYFTTLSFDAVYLDSIALESRYDKELYSYTVGNGEYLPIMTETRELTNDLEADEEVVIGQAERTGLSFDISVENISDGEKKILFPILYYSGYQARSLEDNQKLETIQGDNGRVMVMLPPHYSGNLHVGYYEPLHWRIAEVISAITLFVIIFIWKKKLKYTEQ